MITVRYALDIAGVFVYGNDSGPAAMALCLLIDGSALVALGLNGGRTAVVVITLDRYWKIIHPQHHSKYYCRWVLYAELVLPWLNGVATYLFPAIGTSRIVNGVCLTVSFWPSEWMDKVCL